MHIDKRILVLGVVFGMGGGCARSGEPGPICAVLDRQVEAWNRGDVEGFMQGYWKSDELEFATPDGTTRGWRATLERYRAKYPTREAMGTLNFERLCVKQTAPDAAEVSGRYRLDRKNDVLTGRFTLQMRRIGGEWVIVRDDTVGDPS
ncbi:MAG TPA: nuclear transport factor 2 family protein [Phycisphaerae bacterium]|nr:nuclear transport factor 2 family protein [Phycisphaerae bacterium]